MAYIDNRFIFFIQCSAFWVRVRMKLPQICSFRRKLMENLKKTQPTLTEEELGFFFFWTTPVAYGSFQARGQIRAAAASLHHSHARLELPLQPRPQHGGTPDP